MYETSIKPPGSYRFCGTFFIRMIFQICHCFHTYSCYLLSSALEETDSHLFFTFFRVSECYDYISIYSKIHCSICNGRKKQRRTHNAVLSLCSPIPIFIIFCAAEEHRVVVIHCRNTFTWGSYSKSLRWRTRALIVTRIFEFHKKKIIYVRKVGWP